MARARAVSRTPRGRARAAAFLTRSCHRLLRFLATRCLRRRRASTGGSSPSVQPPLARAYSISTPRGRGAEVARALRRASTGDGDDPSPSASGQQPPLTRRVPGAEEAGGSRAAVAAQPRHEEQQGGEDAAVAGKYWAQRRSLFSLYDRGVRMDAEGWYSATPEAIAATQAARAPPGSLVLDAFAGVGGNSIQFAARGCYVVAVEIDPRKVELAAHNARIYGVEDMIEFVVGDFFHLAPFLKADLVFLSPPWGGPSYSQAQVYTLDMLKPKDGYATFQAAQEISPNIIMFLPRNVDISQVEQLSWLSSPLLDFVSEESYVGHKYFKGITAYFGGVAQEVHKQQQISSQDLDTYLPLNPCL
ncbi:trimethylguanosine synthase-like [Oryza brachyantha]|uniref:trimethylguanosine synthase-like n=1 Tax=Oryza brachyantha TaxID=4533 RepID=UPI00077619E6|nr:trimethylguanosine synthase-like [Oryza brachyantha]